MPTSAHRGASPTTHRVLSLYLILPPPILNLWFFNMWVEYPDFLATVEEEADLALQEAQIQLETNPRNVALRDTLRDLRKKVVFLAEAERHFFYQKAKIYFLKMGDRNTKFFHDMVKRNATRNSISAITQLDGSVISTTDGIAQEFVAFYTSLLGTNVQTSPLDDGVFDWGPKLPSEHSLELYCLQEFRDVSGLTVNSAKSNIFTADIQQHKLDYILEETQFARGEMPVRPVGTHPFGYSRDGVLLAPNFPTSSSSDRENPPILQDLPLEFQDGTGSLGGNLSPQGRRRPCGSTTSNLEAAQFGNGNRGRSDCKGLVTSKAYEYFRPKLIRQPWKATIWKAFIPPKYSFIMWLGLRGRLATWDRLAFLQEDPSCSLCINTNEMAKHLFFECALSACVWSDIQQWLGINRRMSTILNAVKWLNKEKTDSSVQNKARLLALACMAPFDTLSTRNVCTLIHTVDLFVSPPVCPVPSRRDNLCLPHFLSSVCTTVVFYAVGEFFSAAGEAALAAFMFAGYFGCLVAIFRPISATTGGW
ncbi:hypothetical protein Salat_2159200 [Sesamum alatum]|uniref:Reverse transcriptase zinc-binding domain-containing protein n=1 Tax=Sesamum alatum TaxID=300844 RepID=A0AAE1Y2J9_9LAMI|nr:hypothetical protein Salat_2159200 [Sesamum alatum]